MRACWKVGIWNSRHTDTHTHSLSLSHSLSPPLDTHTQAHTHVYIRSRQTNKDTGRCLQSRAKILSLSNTQGSMTVREIYTNEFMCM